LFILQKEQQKTSKEITNHDAVINELASQACSSQDIALEYNYQSGNASNYDAGNEENESGISMVANVESSQEENANLNASMQSNKSSEREISIVLSNDGHNLSLDAPTQLVKPNEITSQIATQEQCLI
jgi:hypothetical protein